jgi:hypothetical protein
MMTVEQALAWAVGDELELVYGLRPAIVARTLADRVRELEAEKMVLKAQVYALSGAVMG